MRPVPHATDRRWRVIRRVELRYTDGADLALDRPAHVRAASALASWGAELAVVSDDANFVATVDPDRGACAAVTLPAGADGRRQFDVGRGNKAAKLDLECAFALDDALIALGSDSGLAVRRVAAVVERGGARLIALPRLYAALAQPSLGSGAVNLEGAAVHAGQLILGNRGGDRGPDGVPTVDAVAALALADLRALLADPESAPVPTVTWQPLALGALAGVPLRLTELEAWDDGLAFAATAEATGSAYDDGAVVGSAIGWLGADDAWWATVVDRDGAPLAAKLEGLVRWDGRWLAAVDADDPARASELLELVLE
jgi:hypothetical protein